MGSSDTGLVLRLESPPKRSPSGRSPNPVRQTIADFVAKADGAWALVYEVKDADPKRARMRLYNAVKRVSGGISVTSSVEGDVVRVYARLKPKGGGK